MMKKILLGTLISMTMACSGSYAASTLKKAVASVGGKKVSALMCRKAQPGTSLQALCSDKKCALPAKAQKSAQAAHDYFKNNVDLATFLRSCPTQRLVRLKGGSCLKFCGTKKQQEQCNLACPELCKALPLGKTLIKLEFDGFVAKLMRKLSKSRMTHENIANALGCAGRQADVQTLNSLVKEIFYLKKKDADFKKLVSAYFAFVKNAKNLVGAIYESKNGQEEVQRIINLRKGAFGEKLSGDKVINDALVAGLRRAWAKTGLTLDGPKLQAFSKAIRALEAEVQAQGK